MVTQPYPSGFYDYKRYQNQPFSDNLDFLEYALDHLDAQGVIKDNQAEVSGYHNILNNDESL